MRLRMASKKDAAVKVNTFGGRLYTFRKRKGYSLNQLGNLVGVSKVTVWSWEMNEIKPLPKKIPLIAAALDVTSDELLFGAKGVTLGAVVADCKQRIAKLAGVEPKDVTVIIAYDEAAE